MVLCQTNLYLVILIRLDVKIKRRKRQSKEYLVIKKNDDCQAICRASCEAHLLWWNQFSPSASNTPCVVRYFTKPNNNNSRLNFWDEAWFRTQCNGYRRWFLKLLKGQSTGDCRFNPDCWRVAIQEYLALIPGHGKRNQNKRSPWIK